MDDSILQRNSFVDDIDDEKKDFTNNHYNFLAKDESITPSKNLLFNLVKQSLLLGAEKLLMARPSPTPLMINPNFENNESTNPTLEHNRCGMYKSFEIQSSSSNEDVSISQEVEKSYHPTVYDEFPLNIVVFLAAFSLKMAGLQISLFLWLFTFPIWLCNFWLMFLLCPFQTLARITDHMKKKLMKTCHASYMRLLSFIFNRLKSPKSMFKLAIRFGRGFFCAFYVFCVLFALLVSSFVIGGVVMRNVVQEPIRITENLTFDYTKSSPVAIVPIGSSILPNVEVSKDGMSSSGTLGRRVIPYNHKMQLAVSLTLPESDYNRKLGIFQVRVESLSANGKVIVGSSYPTMLRFKSHPVRVIETLFKTVPLITGIQSEVQNLKIKIEEFTEGYEPTAFFKVVLEQRAEFQSGSGAPEIYGASIDISSELPQLRRVVWNWRRTIFVWISIGSFMFEMMVVLIFFRTIVLPRLGKESKAAATNKKSTQNKISW